MSTEATPSPVPGPLPRTSPSAQGVDARGISAFLDALEAAPDVEPHSVQVLRHGAVVAEGWWAPYAPQRPHLLYSLSKSFTSTALGFAVEEGLVDLDATVVSYFPEFDAEVTDDRARRILVRHVAAMASGHREETLGRALEHPSGDVVRGFLQLRPDAEPGTLFCYNQPCTFALSAIVQRRSGQGLLEYLRPRLLDPLGIDAGDIGWLRDGQDRELGWSGFHAPTEAVAKLGQLYLQRGVWNGERLLPEAWVEEATRSHVDNASFNDNPDWQQGYGFQFWVARHGYRGDGAYGQFCVVLPEQDAVVAVTSQSPDMQAVLDAAWEHLLPALGDPELPADPGPAEAELAQRLSQLALPPAAAGDLPVGEFTAAAGSEPASLTRVVVEGGEVVLHDSGDELRAAVGAGEWAVTGPLAVSAGAGGLEVVFLETPHRLHLTLRGGEFRGTWATTPLHGPPLRTLRRPV
ncbi:serine hydrolase domain-containing protein [Kineococcus radiotolerans]|uniref:Beta-lactamase n=1 Tax=Kineococcus radiotolerans (strain ATCC BAA-149 / DSM 14245 / SRS30216) TaxID=266940 RepID=A6W7I3_KINRD|nr:serine hydrolase [Kineococcus radiotolerans]ABS02772.1 beta-lactamase [Kineococcus radiotolerans SRS30216 = ATCC BAA-149]